jgi:virulence factor Mce-like protein
MNRPRAIRRILTFSTAIVLTASGCAFQGVNSLPLPGAIGHGPNTSIYHVEIPNVGTLEPNSPVLIADVVVGSVTDMKVHNWHANVDVSIKPDVVVPANAVARVGQTSLLGSMHLELDPPPGQAADGRLTPGSTIGLNRSAAYPSTEQTLSALSLLINSGGVAQIGDIIHNTNDILAGREDQIRSALTRLDTFIGALDRQRDNITATIDNLDRLTGTLAAQTTTISDALRQIPPALDVFNRERPRLTGALTKLGTFSDIATRLVNDSGQDLVTNLQNLEPTLNALADVGPKLDFALAEASVFPFTQNVIDRAVRGDYFNLYAVVDITYPRLKRTIFRGTRWGDINAKFIPAPGDPYYLHYTFDPLNAPLMSPLAPQTESAQPGADPAPPPAPGIEQPAGGG